jgi:hypothetical protein
VSDIPTYAITIAKLDKDGKAIFQASAGASSLDLFTKTDMMKFIKHFKKQLAVVEGEAFKKAAGIKSANGKGADFL